MSYLKEFKDVSFKIVEMYKVLNEEENPNNKQFINKIIINLLEYKYILYQFLIYEGVFKKEKYYVK